MKRIIAGIVLCSASSIALAGAAGGDGGCGWGNALFKGSSGTTGALSYGGKAAVTSIMDEFSEDVARGEGDALNTVAVLYGVEQPDRKTFAKVMHENFAVIFPTENVTADEMISSIEDVMKTDPVLAKYIKS